MSFPKAKIHRFNDIPPSSFASNSKSDSTSKCATKVNCGQSSNMRKLNTRKLDTKNNTNLVKKAETTVKCAVNNRISGPLLPTIKHNDGSKPLCDVKSNFDGIKHAGVSITVGKSCLRTPTSKAVAKSGLSTTGKRKQLVAFSGVKIVGRRSTIKRFTRRSRSLSRRSRNFTPTKPKFNFGSARSVNKNITRSISATGMEFEKEKCELKQLLLNEKYSLLELFGKDLLFDQHNQLQKTFSIIKQFANQKESTDNKTEEIISYFANRIICETEQYGEMMEFVKSLQEKFEKIDSVTSENEKLLMDECSYLKKMLEEVQIKCTHLNIASVDALKVVSVLCDRLRVSGTELDRLSNLTSSLYAENNVLCIKLNKEEVKVQNLHNEYNDAVCKIVDNVIAVKAELLQSLTDFQKHVTDQQNRFLNVLKIKNNELAVMSTKNMDYELKLSLANDEIALLNVKNENLEAIIKSGSLKINNFGNLRESAMIHEFLKNANCNEFKELKAFYAQYIELTAVIQKSLNTLVINYPSVFSNLDRLQKNYGILKNNIDKISDKLEHRDADLSTISEKCKLLGTDRGVESFEEQSENNFQILGKHKNVSFDEKMLSIFERILDDKENITAGDLFEIELGGSKDSELSIKISTCLEKIEKLKLGEKTLQARYNSLNSAYSEKCSDCATLTQALRFKEKELLEVEHRIAEFDGIHQENCLKEPLKVKNDVSEKNVKIKKKLPTVKADKENVFVA